MRGWYAQRALARDQIAPLFERLATLETVADLGEVTRLIEPRMPAGETAQRTVSAQQPRTPLRA